MSSILKLLMDLISPFTFILILAGVGGGIIIGRQFRPRDKNQVTYIEPKSLSGYDLEIEDQSALVLHTEDVKGLPHKRFLLRWPGIDIKKGRKTITRYFAMLGSAFTLRMESVEEKISPADYLKTLWGEEVYNALDSEHKNPIETAKFPITVKIDPEVYQLKNPLTGEKETIPEDDYYRAMEDHIPGIIAEGVEKVGKSPMIEKLAWIGTGFGIACVLFILGVLKI